MWFVVPMAHQVTAVNGCYRDARHQGQQQNCTYYKTGSGGPTWLGRYRRQLTTVSDASDMKTLVEKYQCNPS